MSVDCLRTKKKKGKVYDHILLEVLNRKTVEGRKASVNGTTGHIQHKLTRLFQTAHSHRACCIHPSILIHSAHIDRAHTFSSNPDRPLMAFESYIRSVALSIYIETISLSMIAVFNQTLLLTPRRCIPIFRPICHIIQPSPILV